MQSIYLYITLFLLPLFSFGQQTPFHTNYTTENGLPTNEIYWLYQSKDGLLWIGCDAGLVRYDGLEFKTYKNSQANNQSINGIIEDKDGTLWCYNFASQIFYFQSDSLYLLEAWEKVPIEEKGQIYQFTYTPSNELLIAGYAFEPYIYNLEQDTLCSIDYVKQRGNSYYWIDSASILAQPYQKKTLAQFNLYRKQQPTTLIPCLQCPPFKINNSPDFRFQYGSKNIVALLNFENKSKRAEYPLFYRLEQDTMRPWHSPPTIAKYNTVLNVAHVEFQGDSILWLATSHGLFAWNYNTDHVDHYLSQYFVSDVHIDREHNIWVSTLTNGLFLIPSLQVTIPQLSTVTKNIHSIVRDNSNSLLIAHNKNQITYINNKDSILYHKQIPFDKRIELNSYDVVDEKFWIIQNGGITHLFDHKKQSLSFSPYILGSAKDIDFDPLGNLLISSGQYTTIQKKHNASVSYPTFPDTWISMDTLHFKDTYKEDIRKMCYMKNRRDIYTALFKEYKNRSYSIAYQNNPYTIWFGYASGLKYTQNGLLQDLDDQKGRSIIANDILIVDDSTLWIASSNRGIYKIQHLEVVEHITSVHGLPSNSIHKLLLHNKKLWLGTQKGLASIDTETYQIETWNKAKGLPNFKIESMDIMDDMLYLTDGKQLYTVNTTYQAPPITPPIIKITHFKINHQERLNQANYSLQADENNIEISFKGISFKSQGSFIYQYRLVGAETDWITSNSSNNTIRYPNLSHGNYTFEVKIIDVLGVSSTQTAKLSFLINAPFYRTWWFNLLVLILAAIIIWLISRWQIQKIQVQNLEKLERSQLERDLRISQLKALKAQMNPHFVFNVLNSIQGLYISNDRKQANALISKFSKLVRLTLDMSEELEAPISEEINMLELYLNVEKMRVQGDLDFTINIPPTLPQHDLYIPSLLLQPYVENAIKHGLLHKEGNRILNIDVKLNEQKSLLSITIDDNGIGRLASSKINQNRPDHKSFATSANQKRLELLNNDRLDNIGLEFIDKYDNQGNPSGTTVILYIPVDIS